MTKGTPLKSHHYFDLYIFIYLFSLENNNMGFNWTIGTAHVLPVGGLSFHLTIWPYSVRNLSPIVTFKALEGTKLLADKKPGMYGCPSDELLVRCLSARSWKVELVRTVPLRWAESREPAVTLLLFSALALAPALCRCRLSNLVNHLMNPFNYWGVVRLYMCARQPVVHNAMYSSRTHHMHNWFMQRTPT